MSFQVVPAAYVIFRRNDEVLLQLRENTGYMDGHWAAAAAGHIEAGEPAPAAAVREAAEELGVRVDPADLVPLAVMHRTRGDGQAINERVDFFFECRRWTGEPRLMEPEKAADLRWFSLGALPDPVVAHELRVLRGLRDGDLDLVLVHGF
ncbi:NUDIX domain-containing protein [Saccharopolyspora taberi]|uniref:Nudix hydrolase domain-containing protein n=1 Tax=Saccharopolyspora taberi TaxID=60895 RepID=A0ABN3V9A2_9PSEU